MAIKIRDLTNQKFGKLTVVEFFERKNKQTFWKCKCDCGNVKNINGSSLTRGITKSCGCLHMKRICGNKQRRLNLIGQKFGRLIVLRGGGKDQNGAYLWECKCECGNVKNINGSSLIRKLTKSCGCLNRIEKGHSGFNILFGSYKKTAKRRNLKFNLTKKEFSKLTKQNCFYCNVKPKQETNVSISNSTKRGLEWAKYIYNGVDRVDNNKGYIIENCVPCCKICNSMKMALNINEFYDHINRLYENNKKILEKIYL